METIVSIPISCFMARNEIQAASRYAIGEVGHLAGVKPTTIRWYEQEGLLPSALRTKGGHRVYDENHLRRLGFIRHARELGFPMLAIRALLGLTASPQADCGKAHTIAITQIAEIDARMRRLSALRTELLRMAESCVGGVAGECRILETLADFDHGHCANPGHGADAQTMAD